MTKARSEFIHLDASAHPGHTSAIEFVRTGKQVVAVYVVFDGKRICTPSSGKGVGIHGAKLHCRR
jgi:hypothetical protein